MSYEEAPDLALPPRADDDVQRRAAAIEARRGQSLALTESERVDRAAARRLEKARDPHSVQPSLPLAEWEDKFFEGVEAVGTMRGGCEFARISRADAEAAYAANSAFRARFDQCCRSYAEGLLLLADKQARAGDGAMMRALLTAYLPEKFGRTANVVNVTIADRKQIEALAREMGVDPAKVLETTYQIVNAKKGQNQQ